MQSARVDALFREAEENLSILFLPDSAVFETVFVLDRAYRRPKVAIAEAMLSIVEAPFIETEFVERLRVALSLFARYNLSFGDACLSAAALESPPNEVISFDRDFDRIPGITRIEP